MSQGMLTYADPDASPYYLAPDVTDNEIGESVRLALAATQTIPLDEFQALYKSGVLQKVGNERDAWAMNRYGYKSKKAMYLQMMCCWITLADGKIKIQPTMHDSLDGYRGMRIGDVEDLLLPADASDAELGAAVKEGFRRCTSEWP